MLRLFFENKELELNESVQVAITKQFEDITNPTSIINDWSKTVKIPNTSHNNKIFGHIYNIDRLIVDGDYKLMGVYFNPYKKIDFRLQWGDAIVMTGYAKNISVDKDGYSITLNGELGKVFQEMKKITFDTTTEDTEYLIDGAKYVSENISKDLIYDLWRNGAGLNTTLYTRDEQDYRLEEVIGFAPNNSYSEDFDYKTFQMTDSNTSKKFSEVLDEQAKTVLGAGKTYVDATGIAADTVIGNGLLPREIGEYRSYLQQPYIFFNKLFQIFTTKTEEITGYKSELHPSWFNDENPYWAKLVYMLERFDTKEELESYEGLTQHLPLASFLLNNGGGEILQAPNTYIPQVQNQIRVTYSDEVFDKVRQDFIDDKIDSIIINKQKIPVKLKLTNPYDYNNNAVGTSTDKIIFNPTTQLFIVFRILDVYGHPIAFSRNVVVGENYNGGSINGDWNIIKVGELSNTSDRTWEIDFNIEFTLLIDRNIVGDNFNVDISAYFNSNVAFLFYLNEYDTYQRNRIAPQTINVSISDGAKYNINTNNTTRRSGYKFTLNELWNNEFNPFDEILNYCKQFRIGVFCDNISKSLIFTPLAQYFNDFAIKDWTEKIDYSRDYHIEPITFHNKYILFNYDKYETELSKKYNEKYGLNYGEYKLSTDYEFNNDVNSLFKFGKISIPSTDALLSWGNIHDNLSVVYTLPAEIYIDTKDKDSKNMSIFGSMAFYKGLQRFDTGNGLRGVKITDDTPLQSLNQTYFYTQNGDSNKLVAVSTYPLLDINYSDNICTFTTPSENYTYLKANYDNKYGIYKNFWENYLNERYNKQNKIVTCYVYLTPQDYINFKWNNFIRINNQLFFVNKIYDYNIDENIPTKVDLITIQDLKGYTDNNFRFFNIYFKDGNNYELYNENWHYIDIDQHSSYTIYITSNVDINWSADSGLQQNVEVNGEVGSGVIAAGNKTPVVLYNDEYGPVEGYLEFSNGRDTQKIFVRVR